MIRNISNLEYIFNTKKIGTETQAKESIQKQLITNGILSAMGTTLFNTIWSNEVLRRKLFPRKNYDDDLTFDEYKEAGMKDFVKWIDGLDNKVFGFIKVK